MALKEVSLNSHPSTNTAPPGLRGGTYERDSTARALLWYSKDLIHDLRPDQKVISIGSGLDRDIRIVAEHKGQIDLIATDVVMPEMNGSQLVERVLEARPGIRVLFMSGYTDDEVMRRGVIDGQTAFLQKPFTPDLLAHKVREVLDLP